LKRHWVFFAILISLLFILGSCQTYKRVPNYEYVDVEKPYDITKYRSETVPPIIDGEELVVTFTKFAGADLSTVERTSEALRLGFNKLLESTSKNIVFISRGTLLRSFRESELYNLGKEVEKKLVNEFGVNVICSGTIMEDYDNRKTLSIEIFDLTTNNTLDEVYTESSWSKIGESVARDFFGTKIKKIPYTVIETKIEQEKIQVGTKFIKNGVTYVPAIVVCILVGLISLVVGE